jgi:hypothetical protein
VHAIAIATRLSLKVTATSDFMGVNGSNKIQASSDKNFLSGSFKGICQKQVNFY